MKVISDYQQGTAAFNISGRQYTEVAIETQNEAGVGPSPSLFIQMAPLNQRKYRSWIFILSTLINEFLIGGYLDKREHLVEHLADLCYTPLHMLLLRTYKWP